MSVPARKYQLDAIAAINGAEAEGIRLPIVVMPTGAGKTITFATFLRERRGRHVVLAHRDELVTQAVDKLRMVAPELSVGVCKAERDELGAQVIVASVQTLARPQRLERLMRAIGSGTLFDAPEQLATVIVDEVHHYPAGEQGNTFGRVLEGLGAFREGGPLTVGFTATPDPLTASEDGELAGGWERVVFSLSVLDGIREGWLVDLKGKEVKLAGADFRALHTSRGEIRADEADAMLMEADAPVHAARAYLEHARGTKALAFTPTIATAHAFAAAFRDHGVTAEAVDGEMPLEKRRAILRRLHTGETLVVPNAQVLCLDAETEILTSAGFVGIDEMNLQHEVANWWPDASVTFERPEEVVRRPRADWERMVYLETPRRSVRVTEGHRILYRTGDGDFKKSAARDLVGREIEIPVSGHARPNQVGPAQPDPPSNHARRVSANSYALRKSGWSPEAARQEAERRIAAADAKRVYTEPERLSVADCEFIGFWCGDGSKTNLASGGVEYTLTQSTHYGHIVQWIDSLLGRVGVNFIRRLRQTKPSKLVPGGGAEHIRWSMPRGTGFGPQARPGLFRLEPYLRKVGTPLLWGFSEASFDAFLRGLWLADGDHGAGKRIPRRLDITIADYGFASLIQAVAVCRGYRASIRTQSAPRHAGHLQLYTLSIKKASTHQLTPRLPGSVFRVEEGWRPEEVWCVKTTSKNLITRRRGSVTVMGNTEGFDEPSVGTIIMARPTRSRPFALQCIGRALRPYPGKTHALVLDLVGSVKRHDLMTVAAMFGVKDDAVAERGLLAATDEEQEAAAVVAGEQQQLEEDKRRLVARDLDLLKGRNFAWIVVDERFSLSLGELGIVVVEPMREAPLLYEVALVKSVRVGERTFRGQTYPKYMDSRKALFKGLSQEYAIGAAEDYARRSGAMRLVDKTAGWRSKPASEKQAGMLKRWGRWRDGMTAGEASDVIGARMASRPRRATA